MEGALVTSTLPPSASHDPTTVHNHLIELSRRAADAADSLDKLYDLCSFTEAMTPHPACAPLGEAAAAAHDLCVSALAAAEVIRPSDHDDR